MSEISNWRPENERTNDHEMNRIFTSKNGYQGSYKKVLCCCSAGILRSPTAALVLAQNPYGYNTRACGLEESFALIPFDKVLAGWADEIVVMTKQHRAVAKMYLEEWGMEKTIVCLNIQDDFEYRDPQLMELVKVRYNAYLDTNR